MTLEKLESDINHLRALCVLHHAEIYALRSLLAQTIAKNPEILGDQDDFDATFFALRKVFANQQLEKLEDSKPQLAADILELLESSCKNYPI